MKTQRRKPNVLALAIIGVCAVLYGGWVIYQRTYRGTRNANVFWFGPSQIPGVAHALKPSPPPPQ